MTLAVGASSGLMIFLAQVICDKLNIPEYHLEMASILTAFTGIIAGLLQPKTEGKLQ